MPNYTQYGDTAYQFGVADTGVVNGMAIETISIERTPEFEAEAKNEEGMTASFVRGDDKFTFTASGYLTSKANFLPRPKSRGPIEVNSSQPLRNTKLGRLC